MVEFQAIILAGGSGMRLYPLTETQPKSLLPIDNHPLMYYPLMLLERSGFSQVIVVTAEDMVSEVGQYLAHEYKGKISIDLVAVDGELETAEVLRVIQDKIHTAHFFVLSGDLVTDVVIHNLADVHRIENAHMTMLLKDTTPAVAVVPKPKTTKASKKKKPRRDDEMKDCIGILSPAGARSHTGSARVVMLSPGIFLEEQVELSKSLLKRQHEMTLHTNFFDAHFYIFSHAILDLLNERKNLMSIKADVVPFLIARQFRGLDVWPEQVQEHISRNLNHHEDGHNSPLARTEERTDALRCFAFIMKDGVGYCERADTTAAYQAMNYEVKAKKLYPTSPEVRKTLKP